MPLCRAVPILASVMVSATGCFVSDDEVFPMDAGVELPGFGSGTLDCIDYLYDPATLRIVTRETLRFDFQGVGIGDMWIYTYRSGEGQQTALTFHDLGAGAYLMARPSKFLFADLVVAEVREGKLLFYNYTYGVAVDRVSAAAERHGVDLELKIDAWQIAGEIPAQREFLKEMARYRSDAVVETECELAN